ncbi:PadR family transcriptional regulator [Actinoplanes subtropicus]|uniref:PadR family transcriptional regulator n=1 Tax=Actinoplanes subtropicus TaxID=543632 RepID=UPI0004C3DE92|nr:PadR family transcriptional regulator [Actinoplanes subtropicus]
MSEAGINSTAASLLGFLHDGPLTGWELVARAERTIGPFWSLTRSQVYRELSHMAGLGLVAPGPVGRRESRPYEITDAGRRAFADWAAGGPDAATMRLPLLLFVVLGRHIGADRLAPMLAEQRRRQAELLAGYQRARNQLRAAGADPFRLATLEYGITVARATIRWLDGLGPQLTAPPDN